MISRIKPIVAAIGLLGLAACQPHHPIVAASVDQDLLAKVYDPTFTCGPAVTAALSDAGVSAAMVKNVVVQANTSRIADDEFITGYRAWTDLLGCKGAAVVNLDQICRVREIYTRGDCQLAGVTHY
jgi:hypothetical protein